MKDGMIVSEIFILITLPNILILAINYQNLSPPSGAHLHHWSRYVGAHRAPKFDGYCMHLSQRQQQQTHSC